MKSEETKQFAICINNKDYPASLEAGKLYRVIADEQAAAEGYLRVVDESGEDLHLRQTAFIWCNCRPPSKKHFRQTAQIESFCRAKQRAVE